MIIVHVTDTHITSSTPDHPSPRRWRGEGYESQVFEKLEWVYHRCAELHGKFSPNHELMLVHTGDIFDRPTESLRTTFRTAQWFQRIQEIGLQVEVVLGQHDVRGYNLPSCIESSVGVLRLGWNSINSLQGSDVLGETPCYLKTECGNPFLLQVLHVTPSGEVTESADAAKAHIIANHRNIHPNAFGCAAPTDLRWTKAGLVLCSHIHSGFPPVAVNNLDGSKTWYSAPGALVRLNADEVDRTPCISVIEYDPWKLEVKSVAYETVPHAPAEMVFDLEAMQAAKVTEINRNEFREAISQVTQTEVAGDWRQLLEAQRPVVGDQVVDKLLKYCEEADK